MNRNHGGIIVKLAASEKIPFHPIIHKRDVMPYAAIEDLPENVTKVLPKHAQEIYQAAFNNALDEYKDPDDRRGDSSREETAHKVAWSAVKKEYEKKGDEWKKKS